MIGEVFSRPIGQITVKEENGSITVTGSGLNRIESDINKLYNTSRVYKNVVNLQTNSKITFYSFFALDIEYILRELSQLKKSTWGRRNYLKLLSELKANTWLGKIEKNLPGIFNMSALNQMNISLLEHQVKFLEYYDKIIPRYNLRGLLFAGQVGSGKGLLHGTPVRTIHGWTNIEDLKIGDKVMGETGEFHNVTGVYPQGMKELYRLTFVDGREIITDDTHLWNIKYTLDNGVTTIYDTLSTEQLMGYNDKLNSKRSRFYIPLLNNEINEPSIDLPIDSWLLGVILGDGSCHRNTVTINKPDLSLHEKLWCKLDEANIEYTWISTTRLVKTEEGIKETPVLETRIRPGYGAGARIFISNIIALGLMGKYSYEKFIPDIYLTAGTEQRLELIRGLMDTDGYIDSRKNGLEYGTTSKLLMEGARELLQSVGAIVRVTEKIPTYTYRGTKKEGRLFYRFSIRHCHPNVLFSIPTKKDKAASRTQYTDYLHLKLVKIEKLNFTGETTCISVDNPTKLFVTKDYIITHNTIAAIGAALVYEAEIVIIIAPKATVYEVWEDTLNIRFKDKQKVWVKASDTPMPKPADNKWYIFHYETLDLAIELAKTIRHKRVTLITDEAHSFNDPKSARTEKLINLCNMFTNAIILNLTGTPMKALGNEAIPLLRMIDPMFKPRCMEKFKKIFGKDAKKATEILTNRLGIVIYKASRPMDKVGEPIEHIVNVQVPNPDRFTLPSIKEDMRKFIEERMKYYKDNKRMFDIQYETGIEYFKEHVLPKMKPETTRDFLTYEEYISEFRRYGYDRYTSPPKAVFCNHFEKTYIEPNLPQAQRKQFKNAKSVVKYVDLKVRGECLGTVLSRARTDCNKALLEYTDFPSMIDNAEKKTLIFSSYVEVVKECNELLSKLGYKPIMVFAETNNQLPKIVKSFGEDENINPLIATYQSLSTGVPLVMANCVILLNAPFRIHEKEQTIARANRLGQDKTVHVYNVLLDTGEIPNISTRSNDILEWSKEQVNMLMNFDNDINVGIEDVSEVNLDEDIIPEDTQTIDIDTSTKSNDTIELKDFFNEEDIGKCSDGSHTFDELYYHRMVLFSMVSNLNKDKSWKSKLHSDGTMFDDYFIVGINTPEGNYTYHYPLEYWDRFDCQELDLAPEWDGHKPEDITRLYSLLKEDTHD